MSPWKQQEAAGIPQEGLCYVSVYEVTTSKDQCREQGEPVQECLQERLASAEPNNDKQRLQGKECKSAVHSLLAYISTLSKYHVSSQASAPAKHCPFIRQLPEKHHMSVLSKTSSHKTVSRKISHDTTESPRKPEIHTSQNSFNFILYALFKFLY